MADLAQFEDAIDVADITPRSEVKASPTDRPAGHYLDQPEQPILAAHVPPVPAAPLVDEYAYDEYEEEDDEEWDDMLQAGMDQVNDQDWENLNGDLTKRYNRLRQTVVATHSALQPRSSSSAAAASATASTSALPASNRARQATVAAASLVDDSTGVHLNKVTDQLATFSKFSARINLFPINALVNRKGGSEKVLVKDKSDRATIETVLDDRTRLILFKMIGKGLIERIDGCVSTGKEANVYHALSPSGGHLALKIYKTSILVFKDRDRYVSGEFRFKSGYARSNPRKMVRLWAEKEMRNLRRMRTAGMRVPEAMEVRENVLVMEFMGANEEWQASPRLKDAVIPAERVRDLYLELLVVLRVLFHRCRLVHADFSEYNILYHEDHLVIIDVSQSVEQDHPHAFDFLRADIVNGDEFFARRGVDTLGLTRTFQFVTRLPDVMGHIETDEEILTAATRLLEESEQHTGEQGDEEPEEQQEEKKTVKFKKPTASDELVFAQSYIPRALDQVYNPERDVAQVLLGQGEGLIYSNITGVAAIQLSAQRFGDDEIEQRQVIKAEDHPDEDKESGSGSDSEGSAFEIGLPRGKKHEDRDDKKARRNETKEAAREKRKEKMSKGDKARKIRKTSGKK